MNQELAPARQGVNHTRYRPGQKAGHYESFFFWAQLANRRRLLLHTCTCICVLHSHLLSGVTLSSSASAYRLALPLPTCGDQTQAGAFRLREATLPQAVNIGGPIGKLRILV